MASENTVTIDTIRNGLDVVGNVLQFFGNVWVLVGLVVFVFASISVSSIADLVVYDRTVRQPLSFRAKTAYVAVKILRRLGRMITGAMIHGPQIVGIIAVVAAILLVYGTIDGIVSTLERQQRIREMTVVVRRLEDTTVVADVSIESIDDTSLVAEIDFPSPTGHGYTQIVRLPGRRLYFEAKVLNFEYALIESGAVMNLAIPVAVYSDRLPRNQAIRLESVDDRGVPWAYLLPDEEIYGLAVETFHEHVRFLSTYFSDESAAREAGIRTIINQAVAENLSEGSVREVVVQNTGGITIQPIRRTWSSLR